MFSIHTGMLSGQERKLNFLGATGPQILSKQTNQGGESCPAFPNLLHKELTGEEATCSPVLRSPDYLHTWLRTAKQLPVL